MCHLRIPLLGESHTALASAHFKGDRTVQWLTIFSYLSENSNVLYLRISKALFQADPEAQRNRSHLELQYAHNAAHLLEQALLHPFEITKLMILLV